MRHYLTVLDVLKLFPTRKKSWAYKQLQQVRADTNRTVVLLADFAEHVGFSEGELRTMLERAA